MNELLYNQNPKLVLDKFKAEQKKYEKNKKDKKKMCLFQKIKNKIKKYSLILKN